MTDIDLSEWLKEDEYEDLRLTNELSDLLADETEEWIIELHHKIARLRRQNEKLREGLEFYAEGKHWTKVAGQKYLREGGETGRETLEEVDNV